MSYHTLLENASGRKLWQNNEASDAFAIASVLSDAVNHDNHVYSPCRASLLVVRVSMFCRGAEFDPGHG